MTKPALLVMAHFDGGLADGGEQVVPFPAPPRLEVGLVDHCPLHGDEEAGRQVYVLTEDPAPCCGAPVYRPEEES